ncbi:winged helix-turn-helix transcriptional regulator [Streptomyces formicae]|uniref:Winged helix-turn-helix transcriptional regulator n=1 Tax=Streptomyces formicae TaxID=1616117 RepID=A0ABY3WCW6_9ACTN|nr:winged helix-turn-helix transcriptional regulator [Streptomyces formicae]
MSINAEDPRPPSRQLAASLRTAIRTGELTSGSKLPAIRRLAEQYGVAVGTAQAAMDILRSEGLVQAVSGRGTFVRSRPDSTSSASLMPAEYDVLVSRVEYLDTAVKELSDRLARLETERNA